MVTIGLLRIVSGGGRLGSRALAGKVSTLSVRSSSFASEWGCPLRAAGGRRQFGRKSPPTHYRFCAAFEGSSALSVRCRFPTRTRCPNLTTTPGAPVNTDWMSIVKADHDPIAFNCPTHHDLISRRSGDVCSCHRIPAAVAGPRVHTDLQIHVVAANSSENVSAADQIVGKGHCMARRADPGLDPCPIVGEPRVGIANCCTACRVTPHQNDDIVMAPRER